jgi:glutaredoxin
MADRKAVLGLVAIVLVVGTASQWWASRGELQIGRQVAQAAAPGDIQMLSSTTCGICTRARLWFQQHEVRFDECFIEKDAACAARFEALRAPGTPVIIVRGQAQLGFDPQRLLLRLKSS